jgi:hypothetical protein
VFGSRGLPGITRSDCRESSGLIRVRRSLTLPSKRDPFVPRSRKIQLTKSVNYLPFGIDVG